MSTADSLGKVESQLKSTSVFCLNPIQISVSVSAVELRLLRWLLIFTFTTNGLVNNARADGNALFYLLLLHSCGDGAAVGGEGGGGGTRFF
jgi:hypothetical protein